MMVIVRWLDSVVVIVVVIVGWCLWMDTGRYRLDGDCCGWCCIGVAEEVPHKQYHRKSK